MILGNTHDETRLLIGSSNPALFSLSWAQLPAAIEDYRPFLGDLTAIEIIEAYRLWYPGYDASDVFFAATTAFRSWHGMVLESERRAAQNGPTWVYNFTWKSLVDGGQWGAPHTIDIPFAFDNLKIASSMTGTSPEAQRLAASYADTLIHFARTGDPNHSDLPHWPRYNTTDRPTMLWDAPPRVEKDPRGDERKLIQQARYIQPGHENLNIFPSNRAQSERKFLLHLSLSWPAIRLQHFLAHTKRFGSDFDEFVVGNELDRLLQCQLLVRCQAQSVVRA